MTVYKVLKTTGKKDVFRSAVVIDEHQLLYKVDQSTDALPNTPGIAAFDTLIAAKSFTLWQYFARSNWRIFKATAEVRLSSRATVMEFTCQIQVDGYLSGKNYFWPSGTVLCDSLTIQTLMSFNTPGVLS